MQISKRSLLGVDQRADCSQASGSQAAPSCFPPLATRPGQHLWCSVLVLPFLALVPSQSYKDPGLGTKYLGQILGIGDRGSRPSAVP